MNKKQLIEWVENNPWPDEAVALVYPKDYRNREKPFYARYTKDLEPNHEALDGIKVDGIWYYCDKDYWEFISKEEFCWPLTYAAAKKAAESVMEITDKLKPVYTQEMYDNRELPPVGSKCTSRDSRFNDWRECKVLFINDDVVFCCDLDNIAHYHFSRSNASVEFKPIDQRTDKEKAIDEFMAENLKGGISFKSLISIAYDEWVGKDV